MDVDWQYHKHKNVEMSTLECIASNNFQILDGHSLLEFLQLQSSQPIQKSVAVSHSQKGKKPHVYLPKEWAEMSKLSVDIGASAAARQFLKNGIPC